MSSIPRKEKNKTLFSEKQFLNIIKLKTQGIHQTIVLCNNKGGVLKTTSAQNMAALLAKRGEKVLLVDADAQGSLTQLLNFDTTTPEHAKLTINELFTNPEIPAEKVLFPTNIENLSLIPADITMAGVEIELSRMYSRETILRDKLAKIKSFYNWIFIDCPPSLSLITVSALMCADLVIVPIETEKLSVLGLEILLRTVEEVKNTPSLTKKFDIKVLGTKMDRRKGLHREIADGLRTQFPNNMFNSVIRTDANGANSQGFAGDPDASKEDMLPMVLKHPHTKASLDYKNVVSQLIREVSKKQGLEKIPTGTSSTLNGSSTTTTTSTPLVKA